MDSRYRRINSQANRMVIYLRLFTDKYHIWHDGDGVIGFVRQMQDGRWAVWSCTIKHLRHILDTAEKAFNRRERQIYEESN